MRLLKVWRARRAVILAAKCVESGYVEGMPNEHDPDDLYELRKAVKALRRLESGESG